MITIPLHDHEVDRIKRGLVALANLADDEADLTRRLGFPATAANHDDEAAACRLIVTRLTETLEA